MASWEEVTVNSYAELEREAGQRRGKPVFVLCCAGKDAATGASWCPVCQAAEPVVRAELPKLPKGSVFIYCPVGTKEQWLNLENDFRKKLKLTGLPTLLKYGTPQKLVEQECSKPDLVRMLFTEN